MFLVALGRVTIMLFSSGRNCTWHPRRDLLYPQNEKLSQQSHTQTHVRLCQSKGQVEHVVLLVRWLGQAVVHMGLQNDVTRRAGQGRLAGALELDVVGMRQVQQVVADRADHGDLLALGRDKDDLDPVWPQGKRKVSDEVIGTWFTLVLAQVP